MGSYPINIIHPYLYRQMSRMWLAKMKAALPVASLSPYPVALFGSPGRPVGHAGRRGGVVGRGRRVEEEDSVVVSSSGAGDEEEPPSKKRSSSSSSSSSKFWMARILG